MTDHATPPEKELTIITPDDWHLHLRDGDMLKAVLPATSAHFARGLVMPNLKPPVVGTRDAQSYRSRILAALPEGHIFVPMMTLYLNERSEADDMRAGKESGLVTAAKLYPAGVTTNAEAGVSSITAIYPLLDAMQEMDLPLCIHGESTDPKIDVFDREADFIERELIPMRRNFPRLRIILEHITTSEAVAFVMEQKQFTAATITPHHLCLNRNALFAGGLRPHAYCLPLAKREKHRTAVLGAALSGDARFFLGTDSAPHTVSAKQSDCGCAGIFNAPTTLATLAQLFEDHQALPLLESFCSRFGAAFYGVELNTGTVTLERSSAPVDLPDQLATPDGPVKMFAPPFPVYWRVADRAG